MGFKKKLSFTSFANNNDEDKYWMLVWYGAITFDPREREYLVDAYFIKTNKRLYYINDEIEVIEKLTINFIKSLIFPIGSIFNYEGRLNTLPAETSIGIYERTIPIYLRNDLKSIGDNLMNSNFFKLLQKLDPNISSSLIYIKGDQNDYKIIPNYVLFKHFYYFSESAIKNIMNNELIDFIKKEEINGIDYLFYNSKVVLSNDVKFLGKYFYTKWDYGENFFNEIGNELYKLKLAKKGKLKYYFKNVIPFMNIMEFSASGFYLESNKIQKKTDSNRANVFIVNDIKSSMRYISQKELLEQELEYEVKEIKLFTKDNIKYIDINELKENNLSNSDGHGVDQTNGTGLILDAEIKNYIIDNPTNTFVQTINLSQDFNAFNLTPNIDEIDKEELSKIKILINKDNGLKNIIIKANSNHSKEKIIEYIRVNLDYYALARVALESLSGEPGFYNCHYFKEKMKDIDHEFHEIEYFHKKYYIIESGKGFYSVILRKRDYSSISRDDLKFILKTAINKHRLNWSFIKSKNKFDNFKIVILTPNKHKIAIDKELNVDIAKTILKMKNKFKKKIQDDNL